MKEFKGNILYCGRSFDIRWCAKTIKDSADRLGVTSYEIKTYYKITKIDESYSEIWAKPYGYNSGVIFGVGNRDEINYEDAKVKVLKAAKKIMKAYR